MNAVQRKKELEHDIHEVEARLHNVHDKLSEERRIRAKLRREQEDKEQQHEELHRSLVALEEGHNERMAAILKNLGTIRQTSSRSLKTAEVRRRKLEVDLARFAMVERDYEVYDEKLKALRADLEQLREMKQRRDVERKRTVFDTRINLEKVKRSMVAELDEKYENAAVAEVDKMRLQAYEENPELKKSLSKTSDHAGRMATRFGERSTDHARDRIFRDVLESGLNIHGKSRMKLEQEKQDTKRQIELARGELHSLFDENAQLRRYIESCENYRSELSEAEHKRSELYCEVQVLKDSVVIKARQLINAKHSAEKTQAVKQAERALRRKRGEMRSDASRASSHTSSTSRSAKSDSVSVPYSAEDLEYIWKTSEASYETRGGGGAALLLGTLGSEGVRTCKPTLLV
mmetsp:Transcript_5715/g.16037  ORF Transcript_5715/g.16037 Transcript_5715/m.16037 type:complete len:404 (-) Transcript_5715:50-1261(-)|eukprot:CAMPEP_0118875102 /NCGR_PEP_ID=MMETSP1163-20130328/16293_1 /TAXON_ID=124430 /ORGANISM="Phaeomonas parva, Strain CCMP2877" /LENGTH=403 /DNA_ID=CAMNT_0006810561 /DNA_START=203 /DNA_END=1414 /DNA_ORIENTATION=+